MSPYVRKSRSGGHNSRSGYIWQPPVEMSSQHDRTCDFYNGTSADDAIPCIRRAQWEGFTKDCLRMHACKQHKHFLDAP